MIKRIVWIILLFVFISSVLYFITGLSLGKILFVSSVVASLWATI